MPSESTHLQERRKQMSSGIINTGYDYEKLVPAFFALQLLQDQNVKSFEFQLNSSSYEKFDDLLVTVVDKNDKVEKFAIQIKHRERGQDKINAVREFNRIDSKGKPKGFNISSYLKAYEKHSEEVQNEFKFILFTNATFTSVDSVTNYKVQHTGKNFTTTLFDSENTYQIVDNYPVKRTTTFYQNFFLCSAQKNYNKMRDSILEYFKNNFSLSGEEASRYIQFFQQLHRGQYNNTTITRDEIILKLARILLSNYTVTSQITRERQETIELIESTFRKFDVTILSDIQEEFVQNNWKYFIPMISKEFNTKAMDFKFIEKNETLSNVTDRLLIEICCYLMEKPLFLTVNKDSGRIIYKVSTLLKTLEHHKVKLILVGGKVNEEIFQEWKVFRNVQQLQKNYSLLYQKIISSLKISFHGKASVSTDVLKTRYSLDLISVVTPNEIFQLLEGDLKMGENIDLPNMYIERILLKSEISLKQVEQLCQQKKIIICCNGNTTSCQQFLNKENFKWEIKILSSNNIDLLKSKNSVLYLTDQQSLLDSECLHLKYLDQDTFQWIENKIDPNDTSVYNNRVNLVCGESGSGKTTFMKYLVNKCPSNYWPLPISMQQMKSVISEKDTSTNEMLKKLMNFENQPRTHQRIYEYFLKTKRIISFFDGLNELDDKSVTDATLLIKRMKYEGFKIWMFSTNNLKNQLESELKPICYSLKDISLEDQKNYVCRRLEKTELDEKTRNEIIKKLFNENLHPCELLKVPLFLYILTEILSRGTNTNDLEKILNLNGMYNSFFEGKLQHILGKTGCNHLNELKTIVELFKKYYYKCYQTIALNICLTPKHFELLNVNLDRDFRQYLADNKDFMGFIEYNEDKTFEFSHRTFAEYFAATWLAENFKELSQNKIDFIFKPCYDGIKRFFDGILAEGCPLHLAVLDQDLERIKKYSEKHIKDTDKAGRTALHLITSCGKNFPIIRRKVKIHHNKTDPKAFAKDKEILKILLSLIDERDLLKTDELFKWNCFEYADASMCLLALEELAEREMKIKEGYLKLCRKHPFTVSYFCIKMDYKNFLKIFVSYFGTAVWEYRYNKKLKLSFLHFAVQNNREDIALFLTETDWKPTKKNLTLLHEATNRGHQKLVKLLLDKGLAVDGRDNQNKTPLHIAARMGHKEIVKLLVERGADVNAKDDEMVLHKAAYMGKTHILEYLIANGAKTNVTDNRQRSPLHRAVEMGYLETVKYLIENEADKNATDKAKKTALHYAASEGHEEIANYLINQGLDIFAKTVDGETPREIAEIYKQKGVSELLKKLEDAKKDSFRPINTGQKEIHVAAETNNLPLLQMYLDNGGDVDDTNENGDTALHIASFKGYIQIVKNLLEKNASVSATNHENRVPLHLACYSGNTEVVKKLLERGQTEAVDKWKQTPLHRAAYEGRLEVVKLLVERAKVSLEKLNDRERTPLHCAALKDHTDILAYLIKSKANINHRNNRGETCLHAAARRGAQSVVQYLIQNHKHLLDERNHNDRTALHFAAERGYKGIVEVLVKSGANINQLDQEGKTPLDVAIHADRKDIIEFLQEFKNKLE